MNYYNKLTSLASGLSLLSSLNNQLIAQLRPLYATGRMVESNIPILDSIEKQTRRRWSYWKMLYQ